MAPSTDDWKRPRPGAAGYRRDALVAAALVVASLGSWLLYRAAIDQPQAPWWGALLWGVVIAGSLAFRRRFPELVALVVGITFVVGQYVGIYEQLFSNICLFVALYTLGAWSQNRLLATVERIVIAAGMVIWLLSVLIYQGLTPDSTPGISRDGLFSQFMAASLISIVTNLLYFGAAFVFGNASNTAARQREALEQRTQELEREREVSSRQAVALERVRIARELHDVVAHHVSVMGLQAGAARRVLGKSSETDPRAVDALTQIEENAREAVDELHRMLGALRQSDDTEASRSASTRGLEQLPELVSDAEASGLPVTFTTVGTPVPVPSVVGLSAYRIVQESLTNVRKHGGARATADVRLRYLGSEIEVEVSDTGTGLNPLARPSAAPPGSAGAAGGLGQIGMRERAAAVGGEIVMEPKPRGGYRVRAILPVSPRPIGESA
ncbi:sensor histidine kinase [Herbiconiux sp. KACC 21604]|uniref:sensor histidine kinase n=1 Tax=unclassified Herbiconiux TaxID=2618217 RepID=UPI001491034C|nr:sensor histidine kinase [Herbiconiux sp. SALV-R1]QJU55371.1 sensor histidine kinase [Herbiconiux sp. SALV-R1]WPO86542.1 sensor histidine kinase [Herbiconiux sp. KACC 21604]